MSHDTEITKKENHRLESDVMGPSVGNCAGDAVGNRSVLKAVADDGRGKKEQSPGEDDWHHTGVIHFQRHVLRLAPVHFTANNALGVLTVILRTPCVSV